MAVPLQVLEPVWPTIFDRWREADEEKRQTGFIVAKRCVAEIPKKVAMITEAQNYCIFPARALQKVLNQLQKCGVKRL